jgi:crotonobetainyl-CoA:carnitine CoA-transferase CaiB-like acyl-CoA transferase
VWTDPLTAAFETLLILAALWRQRESGQGAYIDLSMAETTIAALPEPILAWCLNAEVLQPRGNRHPVYAPQGSYPAAGEDRWVALSVQSDAEWQRLCRLMERQDLLGDGRFATADGRRRHHDVLDTAIARWTQGRSAETAAALLQEHGIAAAPTLEPTELLHDPHLRERGFIRHIPRLDGGGSLTGLGVPWLVDGHRAAACRRPPALGEANQYVFQELLGLGDSDYAKLVREQVIY